MYGQMFLKNQNYKFAPVSLFFFFFFFIKKKKTSSNPLVIPDIK